MIAMMKTVLRPLIAIAVISAVSPAASGAAVVCGRHQQVVDFLAAHFHEARRSMGLSKSGMLMEIYASDAGTWTVVRSTPSGIACIVDAGEGWTGTMPAKASGGRGA
jgi:hypothetical protein